MFHQSVYVILHAYLLPRPCCLPCHPLGSRRPIYGSRHVPNGLYILDSSYLHLRSTSFQLEMVEPG